MRPARTGHRGRRAGRQAAPADERRRRRLDVTIGPLEPDIYTYAFNVDGVSALDPQNTNTQYGYGSFGPVSIVQVPGDPPQLYDVKSVPHGEVRIRPYVSRALGVSRTAWVYTPPDYEQGKDFPVLYLLHGAGDIESGWTMIGRANTILDNLIAEKKARPMVVVMPLGHTIQSFWTGPAKTVPIPSRRRWAPARRSTNHRDDDVRRWQGRPVTLRPRSRRRRDADGRADLQGVTQARDRAIAGLSMGGGRRSTSPFGKPELFRYVALMSPAASGRVAEFYPRRQEPTANKQFKLFWIGVGKDDGLTGPGTTRSSTRSKKHGVKQTVRGESGTARVDGLAAPPRANCAAAVPVRAIATGKAADAAVGEPDDAQRRVEHRQALGQRAPGPFSGVGAHPPHVVTDATGPVGRAPRGAPAARSQPIRKSPAGRAAPPARQPQLFARPPSAAAIAPGGPDREQFRCQLSPVAQPFQPPRRSARSRGPPVNVVRAPSRGQSPAGSRACTTDVWTHGPTAASRRASARACGAADCLAGTLPRSSRPRSAARAKRTWAGRK